MKARIFTFVREQRSFLSVPIDFVLKPWMQCCFPSFPSPFPPLPPHTPHPFHSSLSSHSLLSPLPLVSTALANGIRFMFTTMWLWLLLLFFDYFPVVLSDFRCSMSVCVCAPVEQLIGDIFFFRYDNDFSHTGNIHERDRKTKFSHSTDRPLSLCLSHQ